MSTRMSTDNVLKSVIGRLLAALIVVAIGLALYIAVVAKASTTFSSRDWAILVAVGVAIIFYTIRYGGERGAPFGLVTYLVVGLINHGPTSLKSHPLLILLGLASIAIAAFRFWWIFTGILVLIGLGISKSWVLAALLAIALVLTHIIFRMSRLHIPQLMRPLRGLNSHWKLLASFAVLYALVVLVFGLFYYAVYLHDPQGAFSGLPSIEGEDNASRVPLEIFVYQSVMVFATVGPPYPPQIAGARVLVSAELAIQVAVMVIYLTLLLQLLTTGRSEILEEQ